MIVDNLIHARWIIPVEPESVILDYHSLAIDKGRIIDILPTSEAVGRYQARSIETLDKHALLPGFVNCHTHAAMSLMRGIADDMPLMTWLQEHIWPLESRWMSEALVRDGTELAIAEMLLSGTTCFNDMYYFPDVAAQEAIQHGIRANIGLILIDFPTVWAENADSYIAKGLQLHDQLRHQPLISTAFAPHAPYTVSDVPLQKIKVLADELEIGIHMHVHETAGEVEQARAAMGQRPIQRLDHLALINPGFMAVHMTQLTDAEITLFAESGAHIVHCPESNLKLASGFCPLARCLAAGINVALGTDGAASNNDLDMLGELRTAALLAKAVANDAAGVPAATALRMATLNGAKALGLDQETGSLEVGKAADLIAIDLDHLETQPVYNPISQIVYAAGRHQITDMWVAGKRLVKQRQLTTVDTHALKQRVNVWRQRFSTMQ
jgi:5-methylthioadenosine/S-adenosylhomocysteine deaminase